ncbi:unnamed protein product [Candida verbasci]|uniref:RNA exonuclease 3 n=1 Tax=Candida verbasci TaxID=1227364 RepID=A0A9W4TV16_9ASCO|nr:unnamed protein product [Candida verbasci]
MSKRPNDNFEIPKPKKQKLVDPQYVLPKALPSSPATLQERKKFIEHIVKVLTKVQPNLKTPKLKAIHIEYQIAKSSTNATYKTVLKQKIYKLSHPEKFKTFARKDDISKQLEILNSWVISIDKLKQYGYTMNIPEARTNENLTRLCNRCNTEFRLAQQLEKTVCNFHHGKLRKGPYRKRNYDCCGGEEHVSPTCATSDYHVYQLPTVEEKHALLKYQNTKDIFTKKSPYLVVGIDCEMGYTTKGFELLRITAVDFFSKKTILDVYVKPIGQVVDFNTRYSGISEITDEFIRFEESMNKLGEIMDSSTILIGHGLENDLHAMRLIHERIIDTSILYPKHKPSPTFKYSLKDLTFIYS